MQAYTHFRSVFDVSPARPMENAWAAAVGEIRAWIARKEKNPLKGFFFKGGNWTAPAPAWARVETRALSDAGATPEMWAVRYLSEPRTFDDILRALADLERRINSEATDDTETP